MLVSVSVPFLLKQKEKRLQTPVTIGPKASVLEAEELMAKENIGALVVTGPNFSLLGILSERDCVRKLDVVGRRAESTLVEEIMTSQPQTLTVTLESTLDDCLGIMATENIRHLPVVEGAGETERVIGVISMKDITNELRDRRQKQDQERQAVMEATT